MIDVFICTNRVNHTVALHGVLTHPQRDPRRKALMLYEPWRIQPQPVPGLKTLPINIWTMRLLRTLVNLGRVHTMFVPHDALNRRANLCRERVPQVEYLDDGLDTHRPVPQHLALPRTGPRRRYHTFLDFKTLPPWLDAFDIQRYARLDQLAQITAKPALPFGDAEHVLVESPGLDILRIVTQLNLPRAHTLMIRHPVPHKQRSLPEGCKVIQGSDGNLEAAMLASEGRSFYLGETMALVFAGATSVAHHNRVLAPVRLAQGDTALTSLHWRDTSLPQAAALGLKEVIAA
jgi:hypothetical protein